MQEKNRFVRLLVSVVTALMLVTLGVLYIISCLEIWKNGDSPFTRDSIGYQLTKLLIPSIITVVAVIAGFILYDIFPVNEKKKKSTHVRDIRNILAQTISPNECKASRAEAIITERNRRFFMRSGGVLVALLSFIYPIIYLLTPESFGVTDINIDVLLAALHIILSFIPLVAYCIIFSYLIEASYKREVAVMREEVKEHSSLTADEIYREENSRVKPISRFFVGLKGFFKKNKKIILISARCASVVLGVVFIVLGIINGGMGDVLDKAVKICRECIGLG